ncbi:hypothetical protein LXL04_008457 [Taraxacum kok-saghyz]
MVYSKQGRPKRGKDGLGPRQQWAKGHQLLIGFYRYYSENTLREKKTGVETLAAFPRRYLPSPSLDRTSSFSAAARLAGAAAFPSRPSTGALCDSLSFADFACSAPSSSDFALILLYKHRHFFLDAQLEDLQHSSTVMTLEEFCQRVLK